MHVRAVHSLQVKILIGDGTENVAAPTLLLVEKVVDVRAHSLEQLEHLLLPNAQLSPLHLRLQ